MMTMRAGLEAHRALACTIFEMDNTVFHADGYLLYEIVDDPCYNEFDSCP